MNGQSIQLTELQQIAEAAACLGNTSVVFSSDKGTEVTFPQEVADNPGLVTNCWQDVNRISPDRQTISDIAQALAQFETTLKITDQEGITTTTILQETYRKACASFLSLAASNPIFATSMLGIPMENLTQEYGNLDLDAQNLGPSNGVLINAMTVGGNYYLRAMYNYKFGQSENEQETLETNLKVLSAGILGGCAELTIVYANPFKTEGIVKIAVKDLASLQEFINSNPILALAFAKGLEWGNKLKQEPDQN